MCAICDFTSLVFGPYSKKKSFYRHCTFIPLHSKAKYLPFTPSLSGLTKIYEYERVTKQNNHSAAIERES